LIENEAEKERQFPWIHAFMTKSWLRGVMLVLGLGITAANLLTAFTAIKHPYAWTMNQNLLYFGL